MNRGAGRRLVFRAELHRAIFLRLLGDASTIYGIEVHGYCLLANHYHLLVRTPNSGLARAMRHLDGVYTQKFNRHVRTDGPLFRGRYRSVLVADDSHLCCVSRYIHLNPVEAKLVDEPAQYSASSYRAYLAPEIAPGWLFTREILKRFVPGDARENYRRFVEAGIDAETREFYAAPQRAPILGSHEFRQRIGRQVRATAGAADPERPGFALLAERPALETIATAVCLAFDVAPEDLRLARTRRDGCGAARGALVLLGREVGGQPLRAIAAWLGCESYTSASKAMGRLRAACIRQPHLGDRVEAARRILERFCAGE